MENPFLQISVLETLFSYLSVHDLKRCRNVCQLWKMEAFRALRSKVVIHLNQEAKITPFLNSSESSRFQNFPFSACDWNLKLSNYFKNIQPGKISAEIKLHLSDEANVSDGLTNLEDLLKSQSRSLVELKVRLMWASVVDATIPESLFLLRFHQLRKLTIAYEYFDGAAWLGKLWVSILKNAPKLTCLELQGTFDGDSDEDDELWKLITSTQSFTKQIRELKCVQLFDYNPVQIILLHRRLAQNPLPPLTRLCLPFKDPQNDPWLLTSILEKVRGTLEVLEFSTDKETALSPIDFPVMEQLRILDAGSSQLSFPTVVPAQFPKLTEVRATYWDWVYTQENLPDVNYYWSSDDPHQGVTDIQIRFPDWHSLNLDYRLLENFQDFVRDIALKFPNLVDFTFQNCLIAENVYEALSHLSGSSEFTMKQFRVASFSVAEADQIQAVPPLPFRMVSTGRTNNSQTRPLETIDLSPKIWSETWKKLPNPQRALLMSHEWLADLHYFGNLRCLKLLWARDIFTTIGLTNKDTLPLLEHFEFVGNLCVDRFKRAEVRRLRPNLTLIQRTLCYCDEEDWWYMADPQSDTIFRNLFADTGTTTNTNTNLGMRQRFKQGLLNMFI